jgi:hypothetical protein
MGGQFYRVPNADGADTLTNEEKARLCVNCGKAPKLATTLCFSISKKTLIGTLLTSIRVKSLSGAVSRGLCCARENEKNFV